MRCMKVKLVLLHTVPNGTATVDMSTYLTYYLYCVPKGTQYIRLSFFSVLKCNCPVRDKICVKSSKG